MTDSGAARHYSVDDIAAYLHGDWNEAMAHALEEHLAACDECLLRAKRVAGLDDLLDRWTAASHRAALVYAAQSLDDSVTTRLASLLKPSNLLGGFLAAVRVTRDRTRQVAEITAQGMDTLLSASPLRWQPVVSGARSSEPGLDQEGTSFVATGSGGTWLHVGPVSGSVLIRVDPSDLPDRGQSVEALIVPLSAPEMPIEVKAITTGQDCSLGTLDLDEVAILLRAT
jgi:anti-sigma factor RsiW